MTSGKYIEDVLKPYYETPDGRVQLYLGDARQLPVEDKSIDMIATSPPYWGKRDYGEDVVAVWGGEDGCEHEWDTTSRYWDQRHASVLAAEGKDDIGSKKDARGHIEDNYCTLCGAWKGQLGLEPTWQEYIAHLCECAKEWWRVLKPTGNLFVNMGDTFAGSGCGKGDYRTKGSINPIDGRYEKPSPQQKSGIPKNKLGIPYRLRFALNDMGWVSRDDIIWYKGKEYPNGKITKVAMPESVKDRMSCSYEMLFHFVKEPKGYWFDLDAVRQPSQDRVGLARFKGRSGISRDDYDPLARPGKKESLARPGLLHKHRIYNPAGANPGDVWIIQPEPFKEAHYAVWPSNLCERMIKAGCPKEVCPKCGKPRERITDVYYELAGGRGVHEKTLTEQAKQAKQPPGPQGYKYGRAYRRAETIGWSDCGCGEGFIPGVVLDPFFGGSYRIAKEALKLGRNVIGVDMKEEYLEMAKHISIYGEKGLSKEKARREQGATQRVLL